MRQVLRWAQMALLIVAFVSIAVVLRSQWHELRSHDWNLNSGWLLLSATLLLASWLLEIAVWLNLLALLGGRLPGAAACRIWFLSAIVRYVPGNIWQPLSMTLYCERYGVRPEITVTSVALYQAIILLAAAPIAVLYFALTDNWGLFSGIVGGIAPGLLALVLAPVIVFIIRPGWMIAILNWLLCKVGRPAIDAQMSRTRLLAVLALASADWLLWGAAFATLTFGISDFTPQQMVILAPHLVASYPIAYAIGFLSFITPSGFGVREGAFYILLAPLMGAGMATVAALAMRVWTMIGEVILATISAISGRELANAWEKPPVARFDPETTK